MIRRLCTTVGIFSAILTPITASATNVPISFHGPGGITGSLVFSISPDSNTGVLPGTSPNPVDPIGSYVIDSVTGTFSDATLGIANAMITGLEPVNFATPETTNLLAPNRFSLLPVANGVDEGNGIISPGLHFDNIFYPGGSPKAASDYPFFGGILDIYGTVFKLDNGDYVNFWSNGVTPGGLNYGIAVTDKINVLDYTGGVALAAPEPTTWTLMVLGFGFAGAALRRQRKVTASIRFA
jgi:hypothetical protein